MLRLAYLNISAAYKIPWVSEGGNICSQAKEHLGRQYSAAKYSMSGTSGTTFARFFDLVIAERLPRFGSFVEGFTTCAS